MKKTFMGAVLLLIATLMYCTHYISSAIIANSLNSFNFILKIRKTSIHYFFLGALILGIFLIVLDVVNSTKKR